MNQNLSQTFLAITRNSTDLEWLQGALAPWARWWGPTAAWTNCWPWWT